MIMDWVRILAYISGTVDQELLLRNEYLVAENRILKAQLNTPLRLTDAERMTLAEIAYRLGRKALEDVANAVKPDTLLGWYRRLIARKFDGSKSRRYPGRPRIDDEIEQLVVRIAKENTDWGYNRIVGAMANLGYRLESRRVEVAGITRHPNEAWMKQIARNATMDEWGFLEGCRYLIHDRDTKFTDSFRAIVKSSHVEPLKLPARSPNLNAYAERWVKSVKEECLSKLILFGEASLRRALREYLLHFHTERNHQGKDNVLLFPVVTKAVNRSERSVSCKERLGGLLKYYHREVA
jgi:hypothetical protein